MKAEWNEIDIMSTFLESGQKSLLAHPLTETYLFLKYLTVKKFFFINISLYVLYLLTLTPLTIASAILKYHNQSDTEYWDKRNSNTTRLAFFLDEEQWPIKILWWGLYASSFLTVFFITMRELIQLASEKMLYFKSYENIFETVALISTWIFLLMDPHYKALEYEAIFAAIAMFLAWWEMTMMLGRVPSIGMYTYMSTQVIRQLLTFFGVYLPTIVAFAVTFHLLMARDSNVFDNPWTSLLKVLI